MTTLLQKLGPLALASRLKMLSDKLMENVNLIYRDQNSLFEPRWFLIFYQLSKKSPLSITEIAQNINLTHAAVNQIAAELESAGLIQSETDEKDKRRRLLSLTKKGKIEVKKLKPTWSAIKSCTEELLNSNSKNFLKQVTKIENSLEINNMYDRVKANINTNQINKIEIIRYNPTLKKYFEIINYEWLTKFFTIEPEDKKVLQNPEKEIIEKGGEIFFAKLDNEIVGTCALIKKDTDVYELAKMGVLDKFQGNGIGKKLIINVIKFAKKNKAKEIELITHKKLEKAVQLYKKFGFKKIKCTEEIEYKRCGIRMKLELK